MPVEFKDYYAILGVPKDASDEAIKKAFRKLARQHHPDVARDKVAAEARFKEINEAYEVLGDPAKRRKYDQLGAAWQAGPEFAPPNGARRRGRAGPRAQEASEFRFDGTGFSDFFEQFFGGGRFDGFDQMFRDGRPEAEDIAAESHARRGTDAEGTILVTLDEVLRGSVRGVSLQRTDPHTGETGTHTFKVRIPPGVYEGQAIRVPGKGSEGSGGGVPGDLYLRVRLAAHPDFRVEGADLYHDLDLAPWEAALGATVSVPTLEGRVTLRVPPGTTTGGQLRVRGQGLPRAPAGERGDLYAVVSVQVPSATTAAERELWQKLARAATFRPRET